MSCTVWAQETNPTLEAASEPPLPTSSNSLPKQVLSLQDAINLALQKNPDILRAKAEIRRSTGLIVDAKAQIIPKITTNGSYEWQDPARLDNLSRPNSWDVGVRITEPLYEGGQIIGNIRAAKFTQQAAFLNYQNTIDQTVLNVRQTFNNVLLNESLIKVAEENVDLLSGELADQQKRYNAGTVTQYNVLLAEVELANAKPALIHARNNLKISLDQLAKLIALDETGTTDQAALDLKGELAPGEFHQTYQEIYATALAKRSDLKALEAVYKASQAGVEVAKAGYLPTLDVFAGYDVLNSPDLSFGHQVNGAIGGIQGSWNLFDGFQTKGQVEQARSAVDTAQANLDDARRQVELDVRQAYSNVVESQELIESQQKNVESAEESLRLAQARFEAGAGTQLDILNSNVALTQARTNELQARADFNNAIAQLERSMGIVTVFQETEQHSQQ